MKLPYLALVCGAILAAGQLALAQQSILKNGGMELGQGAGAPDPMVADKWTEFGGPNIERSPTANLVPTGAGHALKAFGDDANSFTGAWQEILNVHPNDSVTTSVQLFSPANDKLSGSGQGGLVLQFVDSNNNPISPGGTFSVYPFTAASLADTWVPATLGPYTAPAGTVKVRVTCRLTWTVGDVTGAVYWDDAQVTVNSGPNLLLNGDFEAMGHSAGQSSIGIDDWLGFNDQEKSGDFAHDGTYSLKLGVREAYNGLYQETQQVVAGDELYLSAYAYIPSTDPLTGTAMAGLKLEFAGTSTAPPPEEHLTFDPNAPQDTWVLISYTTTVPPEVTIARVDMIANDTSTTNGPVYMDSASAIRSSAPTVNKLVNPSFESGPGGANGLDNWTEFGGSNCTARKSTFEVPAQQGSATLKISGSCVAGAWQEIIVAPGETLTISAYVRSRSTQPFNNEVGPTAGVKVEWKLGSVPDPVDIGGPHNTVTAASPKDTWIPLYIDYGAMPAGTAAIPRFVCLSAKGNSMAGHVYFDSCDLVVLNWAPFCRGDLNCDGVVSFKDINPFVLYLSNFTGWQGTFTCSPQNGDINGDGSYPSFKDINPFVSLLSSTALPIICP